MDELTMNNAPTIRTPNWLAELPIAPDVGCTAKTVTTALKQYIKAMMPNVEVNNTTEKDQGRGEF